MADSRSRCRGDSRVGVLRGAAELAPDPLLLREERRDAQRSGGTAMPALKPAELRVSLVEGATRWHDPAANREYYGALIAPLEGQTDLIVLPETFTSGFSNEAIHNAETMDGPSIAWLSEQARRLGAAITGSVQLRVGAVNEGRVYNPLLVVTPQGAVRHY